MNLEDITARLRAFTLENGRDIIIDAERELRTLSQLSANDSQANEAKALLRKCALKYATKLMHERIYKGASDYLDVVIAFSPTDEERKIALDWKKELEILHKERCALDGDVALRRQRSLLSKIKVDNTIVGGGGGRQTGKL